MVSNAYSTYQNNSTQIESQERLVEMLFEGILRFVGQSKRAIENKDIEKKIIAINKATDIFSELLSTLDYEKGGEVAHYLSGLYTHQIKTLAIANILDDAEKLNTVLNVAKGLLEAWREVHGR